MACLPNASRTRILLAGTQPEVRIKQNCKSGKAMADSHWQTRYTAKKRAKAAYRVPLFCVPADPRTPCVIHGSLPQGEDTELHHLNEYGKANEEEWFFENLVPICANDNKAIEDSRKSRTPVSSFENLSPPGLLDRSSRLYEAGEQLRAYACARLGSFLAWAPGRPGWNVRNADPNLTLRLATQCLLCLRIVDPKYAVPLATDTVDRSILPRLESPSEVRDLCDLGLFSLAVAAGAFHRDYRDYDSATRYFDLAEQYSMRLFDPNSLKLDHVRFVNHRLINSVGLLEAGSVGQQGTGHLRDFVREAEYGQYLAGKMNVLYWSLRELRLHGEPEEITDKLKHVPLTYFRSRQRVSIGEWGGRTPGITPPLEAEYLLIGADAWSKQGRQNDATELLRMASSIYCKGHFGGSHIGNSEIVDNLLRENRTDFHFPFKYPSALDLVCPRTQKVGAASFRALSDKLHEKLAFYNSLRSTL